MGDEQTQRLVRSGRVIVVDIIIDRREPDAHTDSTVVTRRTWAFSAGRHHYDTPLQQRSKAMGISVR